MFHRGRDCVTVTFSPVVSAQHQQSKNPSTFIWRERISNCKGKLSCHDPTSKFSGNERKRDNVDGEKSYMQISSNSIFKINLQKECKLVTFKRIALNLGSIT